MFDTIRLSKFVGGSWVPDVNISDIAATLGLNYDSQTSVLYAGSNQDNGILVTLTSSSLTFKIWKDGAELAGQNAFSNTCSLTNQYSALSFKKSDNGVAFGIDANNTSVPVIRIMISPGKTVSGVVKIGYVFTMTTSANIHNLLEDGTYEITTYALPTSNLYSSRLISAAPMCHVAGGLIYDHLFAVNMFNNTVAAQSITVGAKECAVATRYQASSLPILFEL